MHIATKGRSWASRDKEYSDLDGWMLKELEEICALDFCPMRLLLDPMPPLYRPLSVYLGFVAFQLLGHLFIRATSFRQYSTSIGLKYWCRSKCPMLGQAPPGTTSNEEDLLSKICVVANETFIEHYLRRHFAWCNSELLLDDIPRESKATICIAGADEILNTHQVKQEVEIYCDNIDGSTEGGLQYASNV